VCRRDHYTPDGRAVADVGVGIEHESRDARRGGGVDGLLNAAIVEAGANRGRADDGDGRVPGDGKDAGGGPVGDDRAAG